MLSLWQQRLVSSRSGRSMNVKRKDYIIHVPQCGKWASSFCKQRAECFHRFLVIVSTEHGRWQASFTPEKSTEVSVTELILRKFPSSPEKPGEPHMHKQCVPGTPSDFFKRLGTRLEMIMHCRRCGDNNIKFISAETRNIKLIWAYLSINWLKTMWPCL